MCLLGAYLYKSRKNKKQQQEGTQSFDTRYEDDGRNVRPNVSQPQQPWQGYQQQPSRQEGVGYQNSGAAVTGQGRSGA